MTKLLDRYRAMISGEEPQTTVSQLLGIRFTAVEPGRLSAELDYHASKHGNMFGTVHGGVLAALADSVLTCAYGSALADGEIVLTLELKINYLRAVSGGKLRAVGRVVQQGRTVGMAECEITDERGQLVAKATGTCMSRTSA